ncbi:MAG: ATP synthase subunit I [Arenicellales bacterium]|jgi:F0F1-type ATP synthase assembly protein I|nr:ATP synthase subunit I [Arenicellales bacterium]MDP6433805.1 ATP synthase subunit I [Arenicellales bacterium]MDP6672841.1 ATP synthase subunit I [Arenicellales bacterium]MDP6724811.1 ATP synthase subunit I [Arenicellales bacterium]|tara:strand:+ start:474 stop:851 length:378 start_codon:yes stop_codon:yes gene_type:complete
MQCRQEDTAIEIRWILKTQLWTTAGVTLLALAVGGIQTGFSALVGGLISTGTNAYLGRRLIVVRKEAPQQIITALYKGELVKYLLTAVLFGVAIVLLKAELVPLLSGYVLVLAVFWFVLLRSGRK